MSHEPDHKPAGATLLTARWVVGHRDGRHVLYENGEVVFEGERILFVGHRYQGPVARRIDYGKALIGPGFIDLDALSDLDTSVFALDHTPSWKKGRVWPRDYVEAGPVEMYTPEELAFQKRYAFAQLIRNGITTALPIASLFYRAWNETPEEFASAAESAADLGLRVYLGPAFRAGHSVVEDDGRLTVDIDPALGAAGLDAALAFCAAHENTHGGLVRTMLAPDRVEFWTADLLKRTADAARDLGVPVRLHCCQSGFEADTIRRRFDTTTPEWLRDIGFLSERALLPHGTHIGRDGLEIIAASGATVVHCPLVMARHASALDHIPGLRLGMGTDTWPPDMILNMQIGVMMGRVTGKTMEGPKAADFYDIATLGGADALNRPDLGRLQPGASADIAVIDLSNNRLGQVIDPITTLMTSANGRDVHSVVIAGRFVMVDRVIPGFDLDAAHERAQVQLERLIARYPQRTWQHPPVETIFPPSYPLVTS